jgi:hypothetical protein
MNAFVTSAITCSACGVLVVSAVPGFAQSNTIIERAPSYSSVAVNRYDASESARYDDVELPPNLVVTPLYRPLVAEMLARSPTFRRQCLRIAAARQWLTIDLQTEAVRLSRAAAWTTIERRDGLMRANMTVTALGRTSELIAHELEHVLEQIDGIDLSTKSRVGASGVRQCECGDLSAYETTRAIQTGLKVLREMATRGP